MTKLDLFCLQMTEKQAISSNNLHFCFSALLLRPPSRSQAYFNQFLMASSVCDSLMLDSFAESMTNMIYYIS